LHCNAISLGLVAHVGNLGKTSVYCQINMLDMIYFFKVITVFI